MVLKTAGVADALRQSLQPLADRIALAFLFGSVAAGREVAQSDINLFVAGDVSLSELVEVLSPLQNRLGREVNPVVYPVKELRDKLAHGHHFVRSVFEGPKVLLIGSPRELERLAQTRVICSRSSSGILRIPISRFES